MAVKDELAGKKGKCKCGASITVPIPKRQAAPPPVAAGFDDALGDLTESDFASKSPYDVVYSEKGGGSNDKAALKKFETDEVKQQKAARGKVTGLLIFFAILEYLQGISFLAATGIVIAGAAFLEQVADQVPMFRLGMGLLAAFCATMALLMIAGATGLLLKKGWGWFLTAVVFMFGLSERFVTIGLVIANGFEQMKFYGAMVPLFITIAMVMYLYKSEIQETYGFKNSIPAVLAALIGIGISAGINIVALVVLAEDTSVETVMLMPSLPPVLSVLRF